MSEGRGAVREPLFNGGAVVTLTLNFADEKLLGNAFRMGFIPNQRSPESCRGRLDPILRHCALLRAIRWVFSRLHSPR